MPRKKVLKAKTRKDQIELLNKVGVDYEFLAASIKTGLESDNPAERTNAREMAATWLGFKDVDKKVGEDIEHLPIGNISIANLERIAKRCSYCKHKKFEPLKGGAHEQTKLGIESPKEDSGNAVEPIPQLLEAPPILEVPPPVDSLPSGSETPDHT